MPIAMKRARRPAQEGANFGFGTLARYYRSCLDLDPGRFLDQTHNLHQRHCRIMGTQDLTIDHAQFLQARKILLHVDDIPGQPHQMIRPRVTLGEDRRNVAKRLARLCKEAFRKAALIVPADYAAGHHDASVGCHAIGIALWCRPAAGLQNPGVRRAFAFCDGQHGNHGPLFCAHETSPSISYSAAIPADAAPACACWRSAKRFSLPVSVLGNCATNSIARGYLYGAISRLTCSCSVVTSASSAVEPAATTT